MYWNELKKKVVSSCIQTGDIAIRIREKSIEQTVLNRLQDKAIQRYMQQKSRHFSVNFSVHGNFKLKSSSISRLMLKINFPSNLLLLFMNMINTYWVIKILKILALSKELFYFDTRYLKTYLLFVLFKEICRFDQIQLYNAYDLIEYAQEIKSIF